MTRYVTVYYGNDKMFYLKVTLFSYWGNQREAFHDASLRYIRENVSHIDTFSMFRYAVGEVLKSPKLKRLPIREYKTNL